MSDVVLDTSVAIPYLVRSHEAHGVVRRHLEGRQPSLAGHSLAETYSVLTRLPGDARLAPLDTAATLLDARFDPPVLVEEQVAAGLPGVLAPLGITGGAVYDALVALAAGRAELPLATRDARAASTYMALGVRVEHIAG